MAYDQAMPRTRRRLRAWLGTLAIVAVYATVMICTNTRFTLLDDEANSIAIAGRPIVPAVQPFFTGVGFHELHPPAAEILLHFWLIATRYSFFMLRVFANIFYIACIIFTAKSAEKLGGRQACWITLLLSFLWPYAFQYGRITGWYCLSAFLLSLATWSYLRIIEDQGHWPWATFGIASALLVWSNYFGFAFLLLLLVDFVIFHQTLARRRLRPLLMTMAFVAVSFLPLLPIAMHDVLLHTTPPAASGNWKNALAVAGYPSFAIFGSAAIAPWFLPLSIPVFLSILVLLASIWFSPGRRWLISVILSMVLLDLTGNLDIKRVPFMLPWLFLAVGLALSSDASRFPRLAMSAVVVIVVCGWIGILSGRHYATANLYEPWGKVAEVVALDARTGATIVSANPPFFLYLDYKLGLESDTQAADSTFLDPALYRAHGYTVLQPDDWQTWAGEFRGKVVMVNGSGVKEQVEEQRALNDALRLRCTTLGEYHGAPDPAAEWKARFVKDAPILAYRTSVIWYDCRR